MSALAPVMEDFFTERLIDQRQASPHTIASYRDTFRLLLGFAQRRTGYYALQSFTAFANGNPWLGSWYLFEAVFMIVVAYKLGTAARAGHNMIHKEPVPGFDKPSKTEPLKLVQYKKTVPVVINSSTPMTMVDSQMAWLVMAFGIVAFTGNGIFFDEVVSGSVQARW